MLTVAQAFALALQHHQAGRLAEAEALYRQIIAAQPKNPTVYSNLGDALQDQLRFEEAIAAYRRAIEIKPDYADAYSNLGAAFEALDQFDEAIAAYQKALVIRPDCVEAHYNLGITYARQSRLDEAIASYSRALELRPDFADAYSNLGNVLQERGEFQASIRAYRQALATAPNRALVQSNLIRAFHFDPASAGHEIAEEQRHWNRQYGRPIQALAPPHRNDRNPDRRLRIGYVSPDFRDHVVGRNLLPLIRHHDHRSFEIAIYSGAARPDKFTPEFRQRAEFWRHSLGVEDASLAEMIRRDGVDILVDLSQHSANNRLPVFAHRPAPVQVSFAGYPESTGVEAIGYRISDRWLEEWEMTEGASRSYARSNDECRMSNDGTECVFFIDSFWCYDPCGMEVAVNALPAKENGFITFGSLNNFCKVNEPLLKLWARVLRNVPDSRLVLLSGFGSHRQRTVEFVEKEGVAGPRVEFVAPRPRQEYLELHHRLDVVLDTFPYNGHTTSLDALWMGVPVVSLAGERPVSRGGLSQLSNLGLPELIAHSEDEYVEIAARLAGDLPRLAELRRTLRTRMEGSVLMDAPRFARNIEAAYRAMWRRWCEQAAR